MSDLGEFHQDNVGYDNMKGGGEWPSKDTPPEGAAPGTDDERRADIESGRSGDVTPAGTGPVEEMQHDGSTGGDRGPARTAETDQGDAAHVDPPAMFKDVLEADPVAGASRTTPPGDDPGEARRDEGAPRPR